MSAVTAAAEVNPTMRQPSVAFAVRTETSIPNGSAPCEATNAVSALHSSSGIATQTVDMRARLGRRRRGSLARVASTQPSRHEGLILRRGIGAGDPGGGKIDATGAVYHRGLHPSPRRGDRDES